MRFEAWAGLSPSPLERYFGVRGPFSGMTEATYRLAHLDLLGSLQANLLTVPLLAAFTWCLLRWKAPRLSTRRSELAFFAVAITAAAINNIAPVWLAGAGA